MERTEQDNVPEFVFEQPRQPKRKKTWLWISLVTLVLAIVGGIYWYYYVYTWVDGKEDDSINHILESRGGDANQVKDIGEANNYFSFNLFHELSKSESGNIFISPFSISTALAMTASGASDTTLTEMKNALGLQKFSIDQINQSSKEAMEKINSAKGANFSVANSIWANENFGASFLPSFSSLVGFFYGAEAKSAKTKEEVNSWVEGKTNGKIKNILTSFENDLYLVNTIYFKGIWLHKFDKTLTMNDKFYLSNGSKIDHPLMARKDKMSYFENKDVQIVELPYEGGQYGMTVFLPQKDININEFVSKMDWQSYNAFLSNVKSRDVQLKMPKFKIEYSKEMSEPLEKLGMNVPFSEQANFSKMSVRPLLHIDQVIHKSFIDVDEDGTEAAAATAVLMTGSAMPAEPETPVEMIVNRPFFFTINDIESKEILFSGVIKEPK